MPEQICYVDTLPEHLRLKRMGKVVRLKKYQRILRRARNHRRVYGDPVDNLEHIFAHIKIDDDVWQEIIDEPYA